MSSTRSRDDIFSYRYINLCLRTFEYSQMHTSELGGFVFLGRSASLNHTGICFAVQLPPMDASQSPGRLVRTNTKTKTLSNNTIRNSKIAARPPARSLTVDERCCPRQSLQNAFKQYSLTSNHLLSFLAVPPFPIRAFSTSPPKIAVAVSFSHQWPCRNVTHYERRPSMAFPALLVHLNRL